MKHIIGCREDDSERHTQTHPAKRGWNRKEMEQWPWKQDCHHISLSLLCPIPVTGTDIGSSYNPEFMSDVFKGMCFWWAESSRSHWISPHRDLIQPAKVRKLNSVDGETLPAASCCRLPLLPTNSHVWTGTHTHTSTLGVMCVKYEKLIPGKPIWYLFQSLP